jgi:hypothetical protein
MDRLLLFQEVAVVLEQRDDAGVLPRFFEGWYSVRISSRPGAILHPC